MNCQKQRNTKNIRKLYGQQSKPSNTMEPNTQETERCT